MVGILHSYIADRFCQGHQDRVLSDSARVDTLGRPPAIAGYVPDAYVLLSEEGRVVIGEAKSMRDLENRHTDAQLTAFLTRCDTAHGSVLVLAVPWPVERLAKALLTNLQTREGFPGVETVVLSEASRLGQRVTSA